MIQQQLTTILYITTIMLSSFCFVQLTQSVHNYRLVESLGPRPNEVGHRMMHGHREPATRYVSNKNKHQETRQNHPDDKPRRKPSSKFRHSKHDERKALYAPDLLLLTHYDPLRIRENLTEPKFTGSTVELRPNSAETKAFPMISKSSSEAIKLHNEMMEEPPHDGMVRVRMYFHQAIHDDPRDYGTGPWNYWGHGWGYEYGFDPRDYDRKRYQRGYTIEKAFGRDFCENATKCRPEDPKFFKKARKYNPNMPSFIEDTGERLLRLSDRQPASGKTPDEILALLWKRIPFPLN